MAQFSDESTFLATLFIGLCLMTKSAYAQDCDFWSGACGDQEAAEVVSEIPTKTSESPESEDCDFWAGTCLEDRELIEAPVAQPNDFWSNPHTEEVTRRRQVEDARIQAEREAENKRLAEVKAAKKKRQKLERELEEAREDANRLRRQRQAQAQRQSNTNSGPSTHELIIGAINQIQRDVSQEIDKMNRETQRRQLANQRIAAERQDREQARREAQIEAQLAALDKQEREIRAKQEKAQADRQRQIRQNEDRLRASQRQANRSYNNRGTVSRNSNQSTSPQRSSPKDDGCWSSPYQCVYFSKPRWDRENYKFTVTVENRCDDRVYVSACVPKKDGLDGCGSFGLKPSKTYNSYSYNATGDYSATYWGSSNPSSDWVCRGKGNGVSVK